MFEFDHALGWRCGERQSTAGSSRASSLTTIACSTLAVLMAMGGCGKTEPDAGTGTASIQPTAERPFGKMMAEAEQMHAKRAELDQTVWKDEVQAQRYEQWFTNLWDGLLATDDKWSLLQGLKFTSLAVAPLGEPISHPWDIIERRGGSGGETMPFDSVIAAMKALQSDDYQVLESEWHHAEFRVDDTGEAHSVLSFLLHVTNDMRDQRMVIRGKLDVDWLKPKTDIAVPQPGAIRARDLTMLARTGGTVFREVAQVDNIDTTSKRAEIGPVLANDLNNDGLTDLVLVGANEIMWNQGDWAFAIDQLADWIPADAGAVVLADFTNDGISDMLIAARHSGFFMFPGTGDGTYGQALDSHMSLPLDHPFALTAGDVDGDGDVDAWLGQYRVPYTNGVMPSPYYDANDGYPAYLLINDGTGTFTDGTEAAGLTGKRFRRTYSASFVDLDGDVDLDLLVVSDFAGIDIYHNDGAGRFTDVTSGTLPGTSNAFGMAHAFSDFDNNGTLDFLAVGMSSTTARRLDKMQAGRIDRADIQAMRSVMGHGNRMYLGDGSGGFTLPAYNDTIARTGWSWGTSAADFDNDGHSDIYIANGHASGESTKDYCTTFWRHDIYDCDDSVTDEARNMIFKTARTPISTGQESWNGYEHNNLLLNLGDERGFLNIAFLLGVGFEYDARQVIATDFNNDGRADLAVMQMTVNPHTRTLHIYQNDLPTEHDWIGVRLQATATGPAIMGATARLTFTDGTHVVHPYISGDSNQCQHPMAYVFGLGDERQVAQITITWPDGSTSTLDQPAANQYHTIMPGGE